MLARYRIVRGKRPPDDPLPTGTRVDTRKHTRHVLRPSEELVETFLGEVETGWPDFRAAYLALLKSRFAEDPRPFQQLARDASAGDVHLGCNCPTKRQPQVLHCHTTLALAFMAEQFRGLEVQRF